MIFKKAIICSKYYICFHIFPLPSLSSKDLHWERIDHLLKAIPNSFNCNQYTNLNNPKAHHGTIKEIIRVLGHAPDYLFCATSTCGTLRGLSEYIYENNLPTEIIAVDAIGSVLFGDTPKKRLIPGHGSAMPMPLYYEGLEDQHVLVSDLDCVVGCRKLVRRESIFAGGASGAVMSGIIKLRAMIPDGATCVAIINDRGGRYLDTVYNNGWVVENFGDVTHLWEEPPGRASLGARINADLN